MTLLIRALPILVTTVVLPHTWAQETREREADERARVARSLVESWGGGKRIDGHWELSRHWVGTLTVAVAKGGYATGGFLEPDVKSEPARFNVFDESLQFGGKKEIHIALIAMGKRSFSRPTMYRESLPSLNDLRDDDKLGAILKDFGRQHGWTDAWGTDDKFHWTEGWTWFTPHEAERLRVLSVFAHVSQVKKGPKEIDHMIVHEGFFRQSDPDDAADLISFPLPATEDEERQRKIDEADDAYPPPLRSFLRARHAEGDSDLDAYFAAIRAFRKQPDATLLQQLVARLDEGIEMQFMLSDLFLPRYEDRAGKWDPANHQLACEQLLRALPNAKNRDALMRALIVALAQTGIESLDFYAAGVSISMKSKVEASSSSYSYERFDVDEGNMKKVGEGVRDELLRLMESRR